MRARFAHPPSGVPSARRKHRGDWLKLLLIVAAVVLLVTVGLTPWAVHMGGRFTPTEQWQGWGPIRASNGGRYLLLAQLHGGILVPRRSGGLGTTCSRVGGCDTLWGTGTLCTTSGRSYSFKLRGVVHGWWSTDGADTRIGLTDATPEPLGPGWVVAFHGRWNGQELSLSSPDNSFTEKFTPDGTIRHVTSTADAGTADVTLRYGTSDDFMQACRTLAGHKADPRAASPARGQGVLQHG